MEGVKWPQESGDKTSHKTLEPNKVYLDSCATYHFTFIEEIFNNVVDSDSVLHGHYNTGTMITIQKVRYLYL